jgi:type VI secretion system ImpB/VipA family protein
MSDAIPKSRVTLTYDTKVPAGREKPRELPFRLLVLGDVGGTKTVFGPSKDKPEDLELIPIDERKVRQLNGRNFGDVLRGFKVRIPAVQVAADPERKVDILIDSMSSFSPAEVLKSVTGQKQEHPGAVHEMLKRVWSAEIQASKGGATDAAAKKPEDEGKNGKGAKLPTDAEAAKFLWQGDEALVGRWKQRQLLVAFQASYQNAKVLRDALKAVSVALEKEEDATDPEHKKAVQSVKALWANKIAATKTKLEEQLAQKKPASADGSASTPKKEPANG